MESTNGYDGEEGDFSVELELVADAGFIGLPNAGKSSLLNALTNSDAKVGNYAFTTLEPNLGALYNFVLADIPGLIEGASEGKGLGHKFLRHVRRTKMLFHLISLEHIDSLISNYKTIRAELAQYGHGLDEKPETIILTKTDLVDSAAVSLAIKELSKLNKDILTANVIDHVAVKEIKDEIVRRLRNQR
jgi:GTP-binding protein